MPTSFSHLVLRLFTFPLLLLQSLQNYYLYFCHCYLYYHTTLLLNTLLQILSYPGVVELTTQLLILKNILWLPLCRINKFGLYFTLESCCDPLHLWVISARLPPGLFAGRRPPCSQPSCGCSARDSEHRCAAAPCPAGGANQRYAAPLPDGRAPTSPHTLHCHVKTDRIPPPSVCLPVKNRTLVPAVTASGVAYRGRAGAWRTWRAMSGQWGLMRIWRVGSRWHRRRPGNSTYRRKVARRSSEFNA